jgi:chromate transporter
MHHPIIHALPYFLVLLKASFFSTGGFGNLPSVHADCIARAWAQPRDFAEALAIGQLSPGPNGLWVVSFGYLTFGLVGALLALLAICLPPHLILGIRRLYERTSKAPAVEGLVHGVGLAAVGTSVTVLFRLLEQNGLGVFTLIVMALAFAAAMSRRAPIIAILGIAAAAGVLLH